MEGHDTKTWSKVLVPGTALKRTARKMERKNGESMLGCDGLSEGLRPKGSTVRVNLCCEQTIVVIPYHHLASLSLNHHCM